MAVLLTQQTSRRLLDLLDGQRRPKIGGPYAPPPGRADDPAREYPTPWRVRWSASNESWIVYIGDYSARVSGTGPSIGNTASDIDDWYLFTGAVGPVYAWFDAGEVSVGMTLPTGIADTGLWYVIADIISETAKKVRQIACGPLLFVTPETVTHASQHPETTS
jgi:hypothetical protein